MRGLPLLVLAGGVAAAAPAGAGFAPRFDQPYRYLIVESRDDGAVDQRFVLERTVTFRRRPDGLVAELVYVASSGDASGPGTRFALMARSLAGTRIVFRLDAGGNPVGVEDQAAIWARLVASLDAGQKSGAPSGAAQAFAALPLPLQTQYLLSMIAPLVSVADQARPAGQRAITLPASGPDGGSFSLKGTETVSRAADGMIDVALSASGEQPALLSPEAVDRSMVDPGLSQPTGLTVSLRRRVDPATGLVVERRQERTSALGTRHTTSVVTTTFTPR